jgi:hypothetical protein
MEAQGEEGVWSLETGGHATDSPVEQGPEVASDAVGLLLARTGNGAGLEGACTRRENGTRETGCSDADRLLVRGLRRGVCASRESGSPLFEMASITETRRTPWPDRAARCPELGVRSKPSRWRETTRTEHAGTGGADLPKRPPRREREWTQPGRDGGGGAKLVRGRTLQGIGIAGRGARPARSRAP